MNLTEFLTQSLKKYIPFKVTILIKVSMFLYYSRVFLQIRITQFLLSRSNAKSYRRKMFNNLSEVMLCIMTEVMMCIMLRIFLFRFHLVFKKFKKCVYTP